MSTEIVSGGTTTVSAPSNNTYIVLTPGTLDVASGGAVSGATAIGAGSVIWVEAGGTTTNSSIVGGTQYTIGNAVGTVISSGGIEHVYWGGTATGSVISQGAYQDVWNGTVNNATLIGNQQVLSGGVANGMLIILGGRQYVGSGGTTNGTIITADGLQYVDAGAAANSTVINDGGFQYVYAQGTTTDTIVNGGGIQEVAGTAYSTTVASGGFQYVQGIAYDATINNGGTQEVAGTAHNTTVASGGSQRVWSAGTAIGTIVEAGGYQEVRGTIDGTTLYGYMQINHGAAANTVIASGGAAFIDWGGSASNTRIEARGLLYVSAAGEASNTTVEAGGSLYASAGSVSDFRLGGSITGTVLNGGYAYVAASNMGLGLNATANDTTVNGGRLDVAGTATNTNLAGGFEHVLAGGTQHNVNFAGSAATLYLDSSFGWLDLVPSLTGTVSNFEVGDTINFLNLAVESYSFDGTTLALTGAEGSGNTFTSTYQFSNIQAGTSLNVVSDGHGGTAISLSLLSQFSASLVPEAGEGAIAPQGSDPQSTSLVHAQS